MMFNKLFEELNKTPKCSPSVMISGMFHKDDPPGYGDFWQFYANNHYPILMLHYKDVKNHVVKNVFASSDFGRSVIAGIRIYNQKYKARDEKSLKGALCKLVR